MSPNTKAFLGYFYFVIFSITCLFVGWAALLSMGDSMQPDKNKVRIDKPEKQLVTLGMRVGENKDNLLPDVQHAIQRKGLFLLVADSLNRPIVLMRKW